MLLHTVPRSDMADLMTEHGGQFGFRAEIGQQPAVDIDVAPRQGESIDVRAVDHSELIGQLIAMTALRHPLTDLLHIGLQLLVGVARVLFEYFLVVATPEVEFLLLTHHHEIAAPGGRIDRTTGQLHQQDKERQYTQDHGRTSNMALSVNGSIQRA